MVSSPLATSRPPDSRHFAHVEPFPSTLPSRANSWALRDDVVRRFSASASKPDKEEVDKHIKCAVDAYHDAILQLKQVLKTDDLDNILSPSSTVAELHNVAIGIQRVQTTVLDQRQIARFVDTLGHYSGVFDVLSQCAFGYMTLIWGSLKFVLLMAKSHYDTLYKFTDVMTEIGINLPVVELYRRIFPTTRILQFVCQLYAAIVEFLQEFIIYLKQKNYRKFFGNFMRPFDLQFGRLVSRIHSLSLAIDKDVQANAILLQVTQAQSMARHRVDLSIRRTYNESCLEDVPDIAVSPYLLDLKKALFHGFEIEASYHEELAATFKMTSSPAWASWLSIEQQYVPSKFSHKTSLVQAECDAPDAATCMQWVTQVRTDSPHIVSVFLLWARGMTAQSAIASIVFQMIQQRPAVLHRAGLSLKSFSAANASLPKLWELFLTLVRNLGGLMVYISIGSVGQEEFGIVAWFVDLCQKWSGPPLNVVIIHPFDENFVHVEECVDLDDKYDVHPSLTTSDALYHVVLLELEVQEALSETVQLVLWEALWREVRYAVIGITVTQTVEEIISGAKELVEEWGCEEDVRALWLSMVVKWTKDNREFQCNTLGSVAGLTTQADIMREQIQRHLNVIDIHLPAVVRTRLERMVSSAAGSRLSSRERRRLTKELRQGDPKPLDDEERNAIWEKIQRAIRPGTMDTYNASVRKLMLGVLDTYLEDPPERESDARRCVKELMRGAFGWDKSWKAAFLDAEGPILEGMVAAIDTGFGDVLDAIISEVGL